MQSVNKKKIKLRSVKGSEHINEKADGHIAALATETSSVTLKNWQHEAEVNCCKLATFNRIVDKKTI